MKLSRKNNGFSQKKKRIFPKNLGFPPKNTDDQILARFFF